MAIVEKRARPPVTRRRSQRINMSVRIRVRGRLADGQSFDEETETLAVSAHGALVLLDNPVGLGQKLNLRHKATQEETDSGVVYVGSKRAGKVHVGIQFLKPSPHFWRVAFPPDDWSERNREGDS